MIKIKLRARVFDGTTLAEEAPTFRQVGGWLETSLDSPVGILPAGLWGKTPGGDPYLLHINVLTTAPLDAGDFFELQSGPIVQPRVQYRPTPSNTQLVLVRPTDRLRLKVAMQAPEILVELLVESIGGEGELGSRLFGWVQATATNTASTAASLTMHGPGGIPAWAGQLHIIHDSANPDAITLPTRGLVPLDAMLTISRRGVGTPILTPAGGDSLAGGLPNFAVTRSVFVINNGDTWSFAGV